MPDPIELKSIRLQNVRNFTDATLRLDQAKTVLVGRNNAGKTGVLRLLDWILNGLDTDELYDLKYAEWDCQDIVTPARETRNKARRITLNICIHDGRQRRGFETDKENCLDVRLKVGSQDDFKLSAKLGLPSKKEGWDSDPKAIQLLERLQEAYVTRYIPSFRDAASARFGQSLSASFFDAMDERTSKTGKKGPQYREYKSVSEMGSKLQVMAQDLTRPVLDRLIASSPKGLLEQVQLNIDTTPAAIVDWLVNQLELRLTTGEHDGSNVNAQAVGSGLQSVLDVALHTAIAQEKGTRALLMVEEPEAFLHPSAQRQIARGLFSSIGISGQLIVTTHSSAIVEEAGFEPLCLVQDQKFFAHGITDVIRHSINTQLLRGTGSEMMFAGVVLLVEGDGDRQFYEAVRRRLASIDSTGRMDRLFVVSVGGANRFCPWIRLARAFRQDDGLYPIRTLVVMDADRAEDMREVASEVKTSSMKSVRDEIGAVSTAFNAIGNGDEIPLQVKAWHTATRAANKAFKAKNYPIIFHDGDLEYASLQSIDDEVLAIFQRITDTDCVDKAAFIRKLGSKGITGKKSQNGIKGPYIRGAIGRDIPSLVISKTTRMILMRWMMPTFSKSEANDLLDGDW